MAHALEQEITKLYETREQEREAWRVVLLISWRTSVLIMWHTRACGRAFRHSASFDRNRAAALRNAAATHRRSPITPRRGF
jgi:hypothetical protein